MRKHYHKRCLKLQEINDRALHNPEQWIQEETDRYAGEIQTLARHLAEHIEGRVCFAEQHGGLCGAAAPWRDVDVDEGG